MRGIRVFVTLTRYDGKEEIVSRFLPTCDEKLALSMAKQYFEGYVNFNRRYVAFELTLYRREDALAGDYTR
ncbi:MAG: hypothetical protein J6Y68_03010 [Clostridia bacterium]|nr:hypothetical protein [Clostridia bacterium]MBP5592730.1 hypothetical protein [Clostridia bacterium]MBP5649215.1 hypothetical protein [Clostridia bacterium]